MQYLIPTSQEFIEEIARSLALNRLREETLESMSDELCMQVQGNAAFDASLQRILNMLWSGETDEDEIERDRYRGDARAAINAINLKLITAIEG